MIIRAFSLIELLVVVSIITVLSTIAVPAYVQYSTKAKIMSTVPYVAAFMDSLDKQHDIIGAYPTSANTPANFAGVTLNTSTSFGGQISKVNITNLEYVNELEYWVNSDGTGVGLAINYNTMPGITAGINSWLYFGQRVVNGTTVTVCGANGGDGDEALPQSLLPPSCACAFVGVGWSAPDGFISTGSGC